MTFEIKHSTPRTDEVLALPYENFKELTKLCRKLERELIACGHEQLTCCNCGAVRNDSEELTGTVTKLAYGTFQCPLCGQENHWRRISRFVTT